MMTPFEDFVYLINHVLLGEEPVSNRNMHKLPKHTDTLTHTVIDFITLLIPMQTIEDFILLVGTLVAFIAFILWCCFPIQPKVGKPAGKYLDPHRWKQPPHTHTHTHVHKCATHANTHNTYRHTHACMTCTNTHTPTHTLHVGTEGVSEIASCYNCISIIVYRNPDNIVSSRAKSLRLA